MASLSSHSNYIHSHNTHIHSSNHVLYLPICSTLVQVSTYWPILAMDTRTSNSYDRYRTRSSTYTTKLTHSLIPISFDSSHAKLLSHYSISIIYHTLTSITNRCLLLVYPIFLYILRLFNLRALVVVYNNSWSFIWWYSVGYIWCMEVECIYKQ